MSAHRVVPVVLAVPLLATMLSGCASSSGRAERTTVPGVTVGSANPGACTSESVTGPDTGAAIVDLALSV